MDPTASKTNLTPKNKKVITLEVDSVTDSESEMEFDSESETDTKEVEEIPQSDLQLSESVLLQSTLHPTEYLGTPPTSPRRLDREEQPVKGMDSETVKKSNGLEGAVVPSQRMDKDAQLFMQSLSKSLPKGWLGGMLNQYYMNQENMTTSQDEVTNINVVHLAQAITVKDLAPANNIEDLAQANIAEDSAQPNIV